MVDISINSGLLGALNSLNSINDRIALSEQRISSAQRINSAGDDAAGLAISTRFESRVEGLSQSIRNAGDGISLAETTDGALARVNDSLQRINELSLQSANGTLNDSDRAGLQAESQALAEEINSIIDNTQFNGVELLNDGGSLNFAIGPEAGDSIDVETADLSALQEQLSELDIGTQQGARQALEALPDAFEQVSQERARFGAVASRFESTIESQQSTAINVEQSLSRIRDSDIAAETASLVQNLVRRDAGLSVIAQGNSDAERVLQLLS